MGHVASDNPYNLPSWGGGGGRLCVKWLDNPCQLEDPHNNDTTNRGYLTPDVFLDHRWAKWLYDP